MSLSDKPDFFGGRQLVLLTARRVEPPGALPCHRLRTPPGRPTAFLGGALKRQGGGYNAKTVSKSSCTSGVLFCMSRLVQWVVAGSIHKREVSCSVAFVGRNELR